MLYRCTKVYLALLAILLTASPSLAQPDLANCYAETAASEQVSVFTVPDGAGVPLNACFTFGGGTTDATVTVVLLYSDYQPVVGYAADDLWLATEAGGLVTCAYGSIADGPTDGNGLTTFSQPVRGGGYSDIDGGERTVVMIGGQPLLGFELDIFFNSPDLDGDLDVDDDDVAIFEADLMSTAYRSDFNFDGIVNLTDAAMMWDIGYGTDCYNLDIWNCEATTAATEAAVVFNVPDGSGNPFTAASSIGGLIDATITVTLRNFSGEPVVGYPADRITLGTPGDGLVLCAVGAEADGPTDASGQTTFTAPLFAGGYSDMAGGERTLIFVDGEALPSAALEIYHRSPDINGDLHVDCNDMDIFMQDMGSYTFRSDFNGDNVVNLSDFALFVDHYGNNCLGLPDFQRSSVASGASGTVSLLIAPDGNGDPLSNAFAPGGGRVDATVTLTLIDSFDQPVVDYPAAGCELVFSAGNTAVCEDGFIADGPSDALGVTTFTGPYAAGGHTEAEAPATLLIGGCEGFGLPLDILVNSPDVNGDLTVDLQDVVQVMADIGIYEYRSDLDFDLDVDQDDVDIVVLQHLGTDCSGPITGLTSPGGFALHANAPNPFNPRTSIDFELRAAGVVELAVFDLRGRLVRSLVADRRLEAGRHTVIWDGRDQQGRSVSSGVYCYRLQAGQEMATRRMVLLR